MDSSEYKAIAEDILKGNITSPDAALLNPLYPVFLALIELLTGDNHLFVLIVQAVIDSVSAVLLYMTATMLFNRYTGFISGLSYALYGIAIFYTGLLLPTTIVIFLTTLFLYTLISADISRMPLFYMISGIVFGVMVLGRPNSLIFLPVPAIMLTIGIIKGSDKQRAIKSLILFFLGILLILSLMSTRNYMTSQKLSPLPSHGGINFYIGNNLDANGLFMSPHGISDSPISQIKSSISYFEKESGKATTPSEASRYFWKKGMNFIIEQPLEALKLYLKKLRLFWVDREIPLNIDYRESKAFAPLFSLPLISFGMITPFALLGIILSIINRKRIWVIGFYLPVFMLSVILFFVSARYRLPVVPVVIIFSSYSIYSFYEFIGSKKIKKLIISFFFLLIFGYASVLNSRSFVFLPSANHYNTIGKVYFESGDLDMARLNFEKAISVDPFFDKARYNMALIYEKTENLDPALYELEEAVAINNKNAAYFGLKGVLYFRKGMTDKCIVDLKKSLSLYSGNAEVHMNLGTCLAVKGRMDEAVREFEKAVETDRDYVEAYYNLGLAKAKQGNMDEAVIYTLKALELNPAYNEAAINLGLLYLNKGEFDKAVTRFEAALSVRPKDFEAQYYKGLAYFKSGDIDRAYDNFDRALKINPLFEPAKKAIERICSMQGKNNCY